MELFPRNSLPLWNFFRGIVFHRNLRKVETDDSVSIECYRPKKCLTSADKNVDGMSTFHRRKIWTNQLFIKVIEFKLIQWRSGDKSIHLSAHLGRLIESPPQWNDNKSATLPWRRIFSFFFWKSKTGNAPNWISSVVSRHSSTFVFSHFHARQCGRPHQPTVVMATDLIQLADVWIFWWNLNKFA